MFNPYTVNRHKPKSIDIVTPNKHHKSNAKSLLLNEF